MRKIDFPNEDGVPNHMPDPSGLMKVDNHLIITDFVTESKLDSTVKDCTCEDWTSSKKDGSSTPSAGLLLPQEFGGKFGIKNCISMWKMPGCTAGVDSTDVI